MLASINNVHMCSCVRGCMLGSVMSLCVYVYVHMCMCICVCVFVRIFQSVLPPLCILN